MGEHGQSAELIERAARGDERALGDLIAQHRKRLKRMVEFRLNVRLRRRVDPSDVLQEAYVEVARRLGEYLREPKMPFYLWLRHVTNQKLIDVHRRHLGSQRRSARREVSLAGEQGSETDTGALAVHLLGKLSSPSAVAMRAEMKRRVEEVLESMEPLDREILVLRHFEQLSNVEAAQVLEISTSAASNRHVRALKRIRDLLQADE